MISHRMPGRKGDAFGTYCADKLCLRPTGWGLIEGDRNILLVYPAEMLDVAKERVLTQKKSISEISCELGFLIRSIAGSRKWQDARRMNTNRELTLPALRPMHYASRHPQVRTQNRPSREPVILPSVAVPTIHWRYSRPAPRRPDEKTTSAAAVPCFTLREYG